MSVQLPCLAKELEVQAWTLQASELDDGVYDGLEIDVSSNSHSHRNLSLFEPAFFAGTDGDAFDSFDFDLMVTADAGAAWCQDTISQGPSSAASCEQPDELDASDRGLESTRRKLSSASSAQLGTFPGSFGDYAPHETTASPELKRMGSRTSGAHGQPVVCQPVMSPSASWRSSGGQFGLISEQSLDSVHLTDDLLTRPYQFFPAPERARGPPKTSSWVAPAYQMGSSERSGEQNKPDLDLLSAQHVCLTPISGVSAELTMELDDGMRMTNYGTDGPDAVLYMDSQKRKSLEKIRRQPTTPRSSGTKRPAAAAGPVARKLMSHPEGHTCTQCGAKSTPVWRAGPLGPKTLCNACGVRYSKIARRK